MSKDNQAATAKPCWEKPQLERLGTIRDIAQRTPSPVDQANQNKRS